MKVFYALKPELLEQYKQTKDDLLKARSSMSDQSISEAKAEILKECNILDFEPDDSNINDSGTELYTITDGIANIQIAGMLTNKVDICSAFFGETLTTYRYIQEAVKAAEKDPNVEYLLFHANSGGGYAEGCELTSQIIAGAKKKKYAAVYDMAASACYWLISQCDEIISVSRSAFIGSIGVAAEVITRDGQDKMNGIKRQTVTNTESKDKRPNYNTKEGMQIFVDELDAMYRVFTSTILKKREGVLTQKKIDDLSGRVLISEDAIDYGLIDRFVEASQLNDYILSKNKKKNEDGNFMVEKLQPVALFVENKPTPTGENTEETRMTLDEFLAQNPDAKALHDQRIKAEGEKQFEAGKAEMQKRIDATVNYIGNENYPGIESLAKEVLEGKSDVSALKGAVVAFDMLSEKKKSEQAKKESETAGETPPEVQSLQQNGDNQKAVDDMKKAARYS